MAGAGTDKTKPLFGGGPAIMLVRPQLAVNIGMCARAMANFGLTDLRLVLSARELAVAGPGKGRHAAAAGARHLLAARPFDDARAAIADLISSGRPRRASAAKARDRAPRQRCMNAAHRAGPKAGHPLRPRTTGLDNDEVALADAIITFPGQSGLCLAQPRPGRATHVGYEWLSGARPEGRALRPPSSARRRRRGKWCSPSSIFLEGVLEEGRLLPAGGKGPGHAAQPAQHVPSDAAHGAGRADLRGAIVRSRRRPARKPKTRKRIRQPKAAAEEKEPQA